MKATDNHGNGNFKKKRRAAIFLLALATCLTFASEVTNHEPRKFGVVKDNVEDMVVILM